MGDALTSWAAVLVCLVVGKAAAVADRRGGRTLAEPQDASLSLRSQQHPEASLAVLVALQEGNEPVHQNVPTPGGAEPYRTDFSAGTMSSHELFSNWQAFLPKRVRPLVTVICLDKASLNFVKANYSDLAVDLMEAPQAIDSEGWATRMKAIEKYLRAGKDVLVSDLDAIWLRDPLPYLFQHTSADVVALRDFPDWHMLNCGFALYRRNFLRAMPTWWEKDSSIRDDERALNAAFGDTAGPWMAWEDDSSSGVSRGKATDASTSAGTTVEVLPSHMFTRENHLLVANCKPNVDHFRSQAELRGSIYCLDDRVMVTHQKGEVYRAKMNHLKLWRIYQSVSES